MGKGIRNSSDTDLTDNNLCLWLGYSGLCSFRGADPPCTHAPQEGSTEPQVTADTPWGNLEPVGKKGSYFHQQEGGGQEGGGRVQVIPSDPIIIVNALLA